MPPGVTPSEARVGFRVHKSGATTLYVDREVSCESSQGGLPPEVCAWLEQGEKSFSSFSKCVTWIQKQLGPCYDNNSPGPEELTNLVEVNAQIQEQDRTSRIDREALYKHLKQQVRGQDSTLQTLSKRVGQHCARVAPKRPLTLFAVGPTGVGKTRTAEVLPDSLEAQDVSFSYVRIDMSEYQEAHRVSQLLGAPAGYKGYGDGSLLLDALQENPKSIIHFDEIEKAHPNILKALMNAMDAGRLSRSGASSESGSRTVECRQGIFFFTSNLDSEGILNDLNLGVDEPHIVDEVCRKRLRGAGMKPELVGRIASFLVYDKLSPSVQAEIAALTIVRVAKEYGVAVRRVEPSVIVYLLDRGGSGEFGVRPLEYLIDDVLGEAIEEAAVQFGHMPVKVLGPPFRCVALRSGSDEDLSLTELSCG